MSTGSCSAEPADPAITAFIRASGLVPATSALRMTPLTGGVASDIWAVESETATFVVKRALARLRVEQEWNVPVSRNASEVEWMLEAGRIVPGCTPAILAHDAGIGAYAMAYLAPQTHPVWKNELRAGRVDRNFAHRLGEIIGTLHARTAGRPEMAARFGSDAIFHSIRLEPYLLATAGCHPDLKDHMAKLAQDTLCKKLALVHGDISPKNILAGPNGPVILDAECAWYGDPAFDLAFCLNHLLLKCIWTPASAAGFMASFEALKNAYFQKVSWEKPQALEARVAALLPALFLARVDGKSPVEYCTSPEDKNRVRKTARHLILTGADNLAAIADAWTSEIRTSEIRTNEIRVKELDR